MSHYQLLELLNAFKHMMVLWIPSFEEDGLGGSATIVLGCCLYHHPGVSHVSHPDRTPSFAIFLSSPAWFRASLSLFSSPLIKNKEIHGKSEDVYPHTLLMVCV